MKRSILFSLTLFLNLTLTYSQTEFSDQEKPRIAILGTFHFAGSSDLVAMNVSDLKSDKRQGEILDLVNALSEFQPTKIILEYPYKRDELDSVFQIYNGGEHTLSINERQQIGFRLAKELGHKKIYTADHPMELPFDELMNYLNENGRMNEFQSIVDYLQKEVLTSMQNSYDNSSLKEYFLWLNDEKMDHMNKNLYLEDINRFGADDNYIGSDVVAKWWQRNFRIMRNIDEITEPNDRVLILFGQGHTAMLKDFYKGRNDVIYEDILKYLED